MNKHISFTHMKKLLLLAFSFCMTVACFSQEEDVKTMHETAKTFMRSGDFDNAIIVLTRALQKDNNSLELQKDLIMSYYLKRDYTKALEGVEVLVDRPDRSEEHTSELQSQSNLVCRLLL